MANQAFMKSVIEGVENEPQWQQVQSFGDVLVQGYYAHKPMSFNDYLALLLDAKTRWPAPDSARAIAEVRV
jgi:EAL domain-containing protein (putative c-di-GMP-specific phosphodiesterase class I)